MIRILLLLLSFMACTQLSAQCPGCIVNPACTANPIAPALCPEQLPEAISGEPYDVDVTFFMPQVFDNSGIPVTLGSITIQSIGGLPPGLSATINDPDNVYVITDDPLTQRGCVKICGTPTSIGTYTISVNVIASVIDPISTDAPQSFTLPISVVPGGSGNAGFSLSPSAGCDSVTVGFQALITSSSQPVTYSWDFGNGNTSAEFTPEPQFYAVPDTYVVTLQTDLLDYLITDVSFTVTGDNWCGDIEEISIPFFGCSGNPDVYFNLTVGGATISGPTVDNSINYQASNLSQVIAAQAFSIQFYDEDLGAPLGSPDDDLGTAVIIITGPGAYPFNTSNGFGIVNVATQVGLSFTHADTIIVSPLPETPAITSNTAEICVGDSILLTLPEAAFYQWSLNGEPILSANNDSLWVFEIGSFSAEIRNQAGCVAFSDTIETAVYDYPETPVVFVNPVNGSFFYNPGAGVDWIWLFNGDTLFGTQNLTTLFPEQVGNYSIVASEFPACPRYSEPVAFSDEGIDHHASAQLRIWPQPLNQSALQLSVSWPDQVPVDVRIHDLSGRLVFETSLALQNGSAVLHPGLNSGIYLITLMQGNAQIVQKLVVSSPTSN